MVTPRTHPVTFIAGAAAFGVLTGLGLVAMTMPADSSSAATRPAPPAGLSAAARVIDRDHDGVISAAEIADAPAALRGLDRNGDGALNTDELSGTERAGSRSAVDPIVAALDVDGDGVLSIAEIAEPATLRILDRNHDGRLTADETRARVDDRDKRSRPTRRRPASAFI